MHHAACVTDWVHSRDIITAQVVMQSGPKHPVQRWVRQSIGSLELQLVYCVAVTTVTKLGRMGCWLCDAVLLLIHVWHALVLVASLQAQHELVPDALMCL